MYSSVDNMNIACVHHHQQWGSYLSTWYTWYQGTVPGTVPGTDSTDRVFSLVLIWVVGTGMPVGLMYDRQKTSAGPYHCRTYSEYFHLYGLQYQVPGYSTSDRWQRWHDHSRAFYGSTRYGLRPTTVYIMILLCRVLILGDARTWKIQHSSVPWCPTRHCTWYQAPKHTVLLVPGTR